MRLSGCHSGAGVQVADTVVIGADSTETSTRFTNSGWGDVSYEIKDDEESAADVSDFDDDLGSPSRCGSLSWHSPCMGDLTRNQRKWH